MKIVDFSKSGMSPVTRFETQGTQAHTLGTGSGETRVTSLSFDAGGIIGPHPTGFAQLFLVIQGSGWVASADGARHPVIQGQGAYFDRGETHSKGSDDGMMVIMIQVDEFAPNTSV